MPVLNEFCERLSLALAIQMGIPVRTVEEAVQAVTADWDVYSDEINNGYVAEIPFNIGNE